MTEAAAPEHAEPILRLRGIGRRFGGLHAVRDVDLDVAHGERRAILGPNGAGKTTLFNVISGDFPPSSGHDRVPRRGRHARCRRARARSSGWAARTRSRGSFLGLTVEDNLYLAVARRARRATCARSCCRQRDGELRERARELARRVGLGDALDDARRLALARRAAPARGRRWRAPSNPTLMMLDEPASGLSRGERVALTELLLELDPSITLILIEHDMDVALRVAERVTMMHDGRVIVEGTPDEIRANQTVHDLYLGRGYQPRWLSAPLLAIEGLNAFYGPRAGARGRLVRDRRRSRSSIIGRNGMGKTTLCNAIMGVAARARHGLDPLPGQGARRPAVVQDRRSSASATCRRAAGSSRRSRSTSTCA